jgi:LysR family transcriptional regulator, hydrogen peroxide-inducible genes activator
MTNLTLKHLRYLDALARHGHFGRAAEACAISQPALSMQIRDMEATLGVAVFERGTRKVRLTGVGERIATSARAILRAVDELGDLARSSKDGLGGRLRIGVIPTVAPYLLPTLARELMRSHPGVEVRIRETLTGKLIQELGAGQLDAAILALPVSEPSLTEVVLFTEEFVLVRPGDHSGSPLASADDLLGAKLLLLEEGHCLRDQALRFCDINAPQTGERMDVSSLSTLVQMVGAGLGMTLLPQMAVDVETRSAAVSVSRFRPPRPSRTIGMVWRKASPMDGQYLRIAELIRSEAEALRRRADREDRDPLRP